MMHICVIRLDQEKQCITLLTHPPHTPWPCRGAVLSQKSKTCWPQKDSLQMSECHAPQTPAGSGSSGSSSAGWSSSWQTSAVSHGALPGTQPCESMLKSGSRLTDILKAGTHYTTFSVFTLGMFSLINQTLVWLPTTLMQVHLNYCKRCHPNPGAHK